MATERQIDIIAKTDKAVKEIEELKKEIQELNKKVVEANQTTKDGLDDIGKSSSITAKAIGGIGKKLKGLGLGVVIALGAKIVQVFNENQKVLDSFNTAFEFVSLAFNDFFNYIAANVSVITGFFKKIFDDPVQSIMDFGMAIANNIVERIVSALNAVTLFAKSIDKVFRGDFAAAADYASQAGKELFDVVTGVENTFDKVADTVVEGSKKLADYTKSTYDAAKSNVELQKTAEVAAVINQGLIEKYDRQAEQQRQIRDEERNTIEERIKANNKLKEVLEDQEKAMLENADTIIATAQAQYDKNKNQENYIALLEAQNEKEAILAQIEGFKSEQKMNDLALDREKLELTQSKIDAENELAIESGQFYAEQETNELLRIEMLKTAFEEEYSIELERLNNKRDLYKEGTLAYQEATNEINALEQRAVQTRIELGKEENEVKKQLKEDEMSTMSQALGGIAALVGESTEFGKAVMIAQATIDTYAGANKALAQGGLFGYIGAAGVIASGLANVRNILKTEPPKAPGGSKRSTAAPTPPAFNIVGSSPQNQIAQAIGNQQQQPVKAYVVSNEVTNQQALDRNIVKGATLG